MSGDRRALLNGMVRLKIRVASTPATIQTLTSSEVGQGNSENCYIVCGTTLGLANFFKLVQ